ncbi:MAG TPA: M23 family metallopeptidase [Segetibacter sp.]
MKKATIALLFSIHSLLSFAPATKNKLHERQEYPAGYFRNPLNIPMQLAANFGELRTNHYHMGFDIRTNQRENLPVFAAAEGYISRIKIEQYGFGRAIYITHPNGYTTLYAHLNDFYPALQDYIKNKQYQDEKWEQEVVLEPAQFPVTKGQFIAFSGNTGGSQGPHLHFEIRDTKTGNNLNPWLFNFNLADHIPPSVYRLYYYDRRYSTYQVKPIPVAIKGANGRYSAVSSIVTLTSPYISFGIAAEDKTSISPFKFGIYSAAVFVDSVEKAAFKLNDFSYNETRYLNAGIDYKTRLSGGGYIQHLSRLPGNRSTIFSGANDGTVLLTDTLVHTAEIVIGDASGNSSTLTFRFKWDPSKTEELGFTANSIPFSPMRKNEFKTDDLDVEFSSNAFYDTVPFIHRSNAAGDARTVSAIHHLHNYTVPVHDSFTVRIKPVKAITDNQKDKIVMQLTSNRKVEAVKGSWTGDFLEAKFRDFGIYKLLLDTVSPRIRLLNWANGGNLRGRKNFSVVATDDVGELESFNAFVDGNWIMFSRKEDTFIHTFDERIASGDHQLKLVVKDVAGNITEKSYTFKR